MIINLLKIEQQMQRRHLLCFEIDNNRLVAFQDTILEVLFILNCEHIISA